MNITIEIEGMKQLQRNLDHIQKGLAGRAMVMAINKTIAKAKTEADRAIRDEYNINKQAVSRRLRVLKARKGRLYAVLEPTAEGYRPQNVRRFTRGKRLNPRRGRQLTFQIRKGEKKRIKGAFIGNRGRTVFIRTGERRKMQSGHHAGKVAEAIEPVYTLSIASMFGARTVRERIIARVRRELQVETDRAVAQVLRKVRG